MIKSDQSLIRISDQSYENKHSELNADIRMTPFPEASQALITQALKNIIPVKSTKVLIQNACIEGLRVTSSKQRGVWGKPKQCYVLSDFGQKIKRVNSYECARHNAWSDKIYATSADNCGDRNSISSTVNSFTSSELTKEYNKLASQYISYYQGFIRFAGEANKQLEKTQPVLLDNTGILNKRQIDSLYNFSINRNYINLVQSSMTQAPYSDSYESYVLWQPATSERMQII